ncbi:CFI-box-CTERM domain-containing protein [Bradyrhizobium sp.]
MTCTLQVNAATASSSGDIPIGNPTYSWTDGAGRNTLGPASGVTTLTLTGTTKASITCSAPGFNSQSMTCECGGGTNGLYLFQLSQPGSGNSGGSGSSGGCFIVTAAYDTEMAPEVVLLKAFRDNVLRRTRWGSEFFDQLWKYYGRISPAIADEMRHDPELRRVLRFAIVEPWVNYMKLMMSRPDLKGMDLSGLDPKLRDFLLQFQAAGDAWRRAIELPREFKGRDPMESVDELNIVLGFLLLRTDGSVYLDDLKKCGEIPLQHSEAEAAKLRGALVAAGRTEDEIVAILGGCG